MYMKYKCLFGALLGSLKHNFAKTKHLKCKQDMLISISILCMFMYDLHFHFCDASYALLSLEHYHAHHRADAALMESSATILIMWTFDSAQARTTLTV